MRFRVPRRKFLLGMSAVAASTFPGKASIPGSTALSPEGLVVFLGRSVQDVETRRLSKRCQAGDPLARGTPEESTRQSWAGMKNELQQAGAL